MGAHTPRPACTLPARRPACSALASPEQEERNLEAAREWMALTYDPSTPPSGQAVAHLLAPNCTMHVGSMPQVGARER